MKFKLQIKFFNAFNTIRPRQMSSSRIKVYVACFKKNLENFDIKKRQLRTSLKKLEIKKNLFK